MSETVRQHYIYNLYLLSRNPSETYTIPSNIARCVGVDWDYIAALEGEDKANTALVERLAELITGDSCVMLYAPSGDGTMCKCMSCRAWTNDPAPRYCSGCGARVSRIIDKYSALEAVDE